MLDSMTKPLKFERCDLNLPDLQTNDCPLPNLRIPNETGEPIAMNTRDPISATRENRSHLVWSIALLTVGFVGFVGLSATGVATTTDYNHETVRSKNDRLENPSQQIKTTEEVYKNIQVFKGLPASQLESTMAFISGSLGVKCNYCHTNPFDKDDKATKQTARRMMRMVFDLNKVNFGSETAVTCFTCHRGNPRPVAVPAVGWNLWDPSAPAPKDSPLPTVDQILDRYVEALGGASTMRKVTSRVVKGSRIGADGVLVPEEVFQKAPNRILTVTSYPQVVFRSGFNGTAAWGHSSRDGARELPVEVAADLKSESEFYREMKIKELYSKLNVVGKEAIGNAEAYVIEATPSSGRAERMYFDVSTGLLLRRYSVSGTFLGKLPLQIDFEDYREVDGVKQPFLIHWSFPGRVWGRKITEIKQNVDLNDSQFEPPSAPVAK
jgi:hypothetical protein